MKNLNFLKQLKQNLHTKQDAAFFNLLEEIFGYLPLSIIVQMFNSSSSSTIASKIGLVEQSLGRGSVSAEDIVEGIRKNISEQIELMTKSIQGGGYEIIDNKNGTFYWEYEDGDASEDFTDINNVIADAYFQLTGDHDEKPI